VCNNLNFIEMNIRIKTIAVILLIGSFSAFNFLNSKAQGIIQSVIPTSGIPGQQHEIVIRASGVQFAAGITSVSLGEGIIINYIHVNNSFTLRVGIQIEENASPGNRNLKVISGSQIIDLENAFEVISAGGNLQAILEIVPAQTISASDFDPDNPALAPLLFKITVLNNQVLHNLKVVFSLFLENRGLLGKAIKKLPQVAPGAIKYLDNRDFDTYEFSPESEEVANQVLTTGVLPAGTYTYRIDIYDDSNQLLGSTEAQNTLTNQGTDLVLIAPGGSLDYPPEVIPMSLPIFQWISTANQFDLLLYKVEPGQTNTQQIIQSQPVFKQLSILGNTFMYPLSAEQLEVGKTYAWQIRAYVNNTNGNLIIESALYWFDYAKAETSNIEITSFKVIPEQTDVVIGNTAQFTVQALDAQGHVLNITPVWKVTPSTDGIIATNGLFKAGNKPKTIAVVAVYGTHQDYAVVNLKMPPLVYNEFDILYQLFGNKNNLKKGKL
jgi:hypothetical protein